MEISIIVPVYNVEEYLTCCINSLLNQDFSLEYEIICINDGSTDNSFNILKSFNTVSEKIVIINQKNKGLSGARNIGLKNAKGKYVIFIDSDDYLKHTGVLTLMYNEIEKDDLDFVIGNFEYSYVDKNKNYRKQRDNSIKSKIMSGKDFYELASRTNSVMSVVWNKLYKKEFLVKNNLFFIEGIIFEDMEFTPRAYYLAKRVKYIDEIIIMYRQREGSIMSSKNIQKVNDCFVVAYNLNNFNKNYNSKVLLNMEINMYIEVVRKLKYIKDKQIYKLRLKEMGMVSKCIKSSKLKYKIFAIMYLFRFFDKY